MTKASFLKIATTVAKAWDLDESPVVDFHYLDQIQFLPKDKQPYIQITNSENDLSVESGYEVFFVRCRDGEEFDVTDHVAITHNIVDGVQQLRIQLAYLPTDHHSELLYLKIDRNLPPSAKGAIYYSNPFLVTNDDKELTTRVDYKSFETTGAPKKGFNSIRLKFYENNYNPATEIKSYFQITTGQLTNSRVLLRKYKQWQTKPFNSFTFQRLEEAMYLGPCYFDQIRQYPAENLQYNPREGNSNISEMQLITDPNPNDFLTITPIVIGGNVIDFRVNVPNILINDPDNHLITQTQITA